MSISSKLVKIAGERGVIEEQAKMKSFNYSCSLDPPRTPNYVVRTKSAEEVRKVIKLANKEGVPVIPSSSAIHFNGNTIANQGGIVIDLSGMKKIIEFDERNRKVMIEPGVTWKELGARLKKKQAMTMNPLLPHARSSVVTACLERQPALNPQFEYGEPISSMEMVWPTGEIFRTGTASSTGYPKNFADGGYPYGPGPIDPIRLLQGAQGTMGIVTWANIKTEFLPPVNKSFFIGFESMNTMVEALYAIQRRRIGHECFALDNLNLATILARDMSDDFPKLRKALPGWSVLLILGGGRWFPEDKIAYQEEALRELQANVFPDSPLEEVIPGYGSTRTLPELLRNPWPEEELYWKWRTRGACQDMFFITVLEKAPLLAAAVSETVEECGFDPHNLGIYIQPIENASAAHMEFNFYYNPNSPEEVATTKFAYAAAIEEALKLEAHFSRPYGKIMSDLVYEKAGSYTALLKQTKEMFDPKHIMNPGKLCF
ncbi:MAG: FAD-binding oxidoreductase [Dehalococcoidia bacterium]